MKKRTYPSRTGAGRSRADLRDKGVKYDERKANFDLLPWLAIECVAVVLHDGKIKYDEHNWRKGIHYARLARAAIGHVASYIRGDDYDKETGLPHLAHAACCVLFLLEYFLIDRATGEYGKLDNRYKLSPKVQAEFPSMDCFRDPEYRRPPL